MSETGFRDYLRTFDKERLIDMLTDAAKNWLAHDGLWFLAVESDLGMEKAIAYDAEAWRRFTVIEARRIMARHGIEPGGGLDALEQALRFRMYAYINEQRLERDGGRLNLFVTRCRVQHARTRDGRPDFPCKPVGLVEYRYFAETIDPRIRTTCICCPPDDHPDDYWCGWSFSLDETEAGGD